MGIGVAHFFARRLEEAKAVLLQSLQEKPNWAPTYRFLASCYAHMGRLDQAREAVGRLPALTNELVPSATNWRNPEHREFYLSGLRLAIGEQTLARPAASSRSLPPIWWATRVLLGADEGGILQVLIAIEAELLDFLIPRNAGWSRRRVTPPCGTWQLTRASR
jgi:tetratricopeptide (TPR) repeat protein